MALTARDIKNDATTDVGFDLVNDSVAGLGDIAVTKIVVGAAGVSGGVVEATNPFPVRLCDAAGWLSSLPVSDGGGSITIDGTVTANAGTGPWPVTDNDGSLTIDDGGGSITVDGSVSVSGSVDTELTTADFDTGTGTDIRAVVGLVLAESGGGVLVGSANPLPVSDAGGSLTVDGTVTANAGTGPWPVTDNDGSLTVDDGGGSLTVDGTVTANAGTGTFTVDTPDGSIAIDELPAAAVLTDSFANPTTTVVGACLLGFNGATWDRLVVGGGTEAGALRVTIANDSTGLVSVDDGGGTLSIDDGGGSITVDGTVSISGSVDTELTTADFDTGAGTDTRAVVGLVLAESGGGVLVGSDNPLPVSDAGGSLTVDGTVTANAGTGPWPVTDNGGSLTVDDGGSSLTVDGTLAVTQATHDNLNTNANLQIGDTDVSGSFPVPVADADIAYDGTTTAAIKRFRVIATASGDNQLIAAVAGKRFRLRSLAVLATSATSVQFYLHTTTDTNVLGDATNSLTVDVDGGDGPAGFVLQQNTDGWVETNTANEALQINLSAATPVVVLGTYIEVT